MSLLVQCTCTFTQVIAKFSEFKVVFKQESVTGICMYKYNITYVLVATYMYVYVHYDHSLAMLLLKGLAYFFL